MEGIRRFYFKNKRVIYSIFTLFILLLFLIIPLVFLFTKDEEVNVFELKDPEVKFNVVPTYDINRDGTTVDWRFSFDTSFINNGWEIKEYYVVIGDNSQNIDTPPSIGNGQNGEKLIWTKNINTSNELIKSSIIYEDVFEANVSDEDPLFKYKLSLFINQINSSTEFINDGITPVIEDLDPNATENKNKRVYAGATFKNGDYTKKIRLEQTSINLLNCDISQEGEFIINDPNPVSIYKPEDVLFEYDEVNNKYVANITSLQNFITYVGNNTYIDVFNGTMQIKILWDEQNNYIDKYGVNIYEKIPTLNIAINAIDYETGSKVEIYNDVDIKLTSESNLDGTSTQYLFSTEIIDVSSFNEIYDEGIMSYDDVEVNASISWKFKSEEQITSEYFQSNNVSEAASNVSFNYSYTDNYNSTNLDVEREIIIADENYIDGVVPNDSKAFVELLKYNVQSNLNFIYWLNINDNGLMDMYIIFSPKSLFSHPKFNINDFIFISYLWMYDENGAKTYSRTAFNKMQISKFNEMNYYWFKINTPYSYKSESEYRISTDSYFKLLANLESNTNYIPIGNTDRMLYYYNESTHFKYRSEDDYSKEEILKEINNESGNIIYLPSNIHLMAFDHTYDSTITWLFIILTIVIIFIVPVTIILLSKFVFRRI